MTSSIARFILRLFGWQVSGPNPRHLKKYLTIAVTHTSNWDLPLGLLAKVVLKLNLSWVGKSSLFRPPFGFIFRMLGGLPVDRSKNNNFVDSIIQLYDEHDDLCIFLAPEGTRGKVDQLKTGFYYIALGAKIPIVMIRLDFGTKNLAFSEPFYPTGNKEEDFAKIYDYFKGVVGKNKEWSWQHPEENKELKS